MILDEILKNKNTEIEKLKSYFSIEDLMLKISGLKAVRDFEKALRNEKKNPVRIIAEVKKPLHRRVFCGKVTFTLLI